MGRDTDDVARVHVLSLDSEKVPGNRRYLLASPEIVDLRRVAMVRARLCISRVLPFLVRVDDGVK